MLSVLNVRKAPDVSSIFRGGSRLIEKSGLEDPGNFHLTNVFIAVAGQDHAHLPRLPDRDRIMTTRVLDVRNVLRSRPDVVT